MGDRDFLLPGAANSVDNRIPDFSKKFANLHYQSPTTGEFGTIVIRPNTTEDDVIRQYERIFPKECSMHLELINEMSKALDKPTGMSQLGIMSALTKIPEIVYLSMKYFDPDFWGNKKNVNRFVRRYPKLMMRRSR